MGILIWNTGCVLEDPVHAEDMVPTQSATPSRSLTSETFLRHVNRQLVHNNVTRPPFFVEERTPALKRYPCTECHVQSTPQRMTEAVLRKAHWDIRLEHASSEVMSCATCHSPTMEHLQTLGGHPIDWNHSYQLCAQCHTRQSQDWYGGAHGKRVGGWAPPRVVKNCPECHNPHRPRLEKRWPSRSMELLHRPQP